MLDNVPEKYVWFVAILAIGITADQLTKWYASERLATTRPGILEHPITLQVPESADSTTVRDFLGREFAANGPEVLDAIARSEVRTPEGDRLGPDSKLDPGQRVVVENRTVTVLEHYWEFEYTVNPGAAFGLLSDANSQYRLPFFIVVSLLAVAVILYLLRGVHPSQKILIVSLSFIGTGAVGNFIDRVRFGHVIDFIVWKYTDQWRWPTFNIADALITVGVALMLFELFQGAAEPEERDTSESTDDSEAAEPA